MTTPFTYKDAGVDIKEAAALVNDIGSLRQRTEKQRKLFQPFGLFAASYDLSAYREPVIVTGCDGVGTKLDLLLKFDELEIAGKDLVAMNVNDVLTSGADPILFLDYIGVGRIDKAKITRVISGMVDYLEACGCILGGGETAEMPDLVEENMIELSGFCIGAAEKGDLIDNKTIADGDVVLGYPSDGFHANGWSLVRRIIKTNSTDFKEDEIRSLLAPTRLYHEEVKRLRDAGIAVKAYAHITGGGLPENLERLLDGKGLDLKVPRWDNEVIQKILHHVEEAEAFRTFNMGFGWVAIIHPNDRESALAADSTAQVLGHVQGSAINIAVV